MDPTHVDASSSTNNAKLLAVRDATGEERTRLEEELVRSYAPMAHRLAARFSSYGADPDDLLQVAMIAVLEAIRRFEPERGLFDPYARATINGELKKYLRDHCWSIKPPRRIQELQSQVTRTAAALAQQDGHEPGQAELAEAVDAPVAEVAEALMARACYSPPSLDQPTGAAGSPLSERLADDDEPFARVDDWLSLGQICSELNDEDRTLIRLRFYECMSQREIAAEIGISQMQVSRRLTRLLDALRIRALERDVA